MADPWRDRARRAVEARRLLRTGTDQRAHYVVCGQDALAFHLVNSLLGTEVPSRPIRITVIVPQRRRPDWPEIRPVKGVRVIRADRLDEETFRTADLAGATGLALLHQDDVGNIHAALCAQAVEPRARVVIRMFNTNLASGVRRLLPDCAVLSDAAMAAPAFVAAALGEVAPTHFRHGGRTLYVARRAEAGGRPVVCGLADTRDPGHPRVLPADPGQADLVLVEASGPPSGEAPPRPPVPARRRRAAGLMALSALRSFATRKIGIATMAVLGVIVVFGFLLSRAESVNLWQGLYLALSITIGGADPDLDKGAWAQVMQLVLNLAGLALVPLITAAVVDGVVNAKLALTTGKGQPHREGHVVVVGLGNVGTRVMRQLHDLGVEMVVIDKDPDARGAPVARRLNIPLVIGDAALEGTLVTASVGSCRALLILSTDDVTNLQAALNGRALKHDLRVVLRLFDGDFAERIQQAFNITISRSVSYLAAPSFAAALLDRVVIATIPVERHVLLVAEVTVAAGSAFDGATVAAVGTQAQGVRVLAVHRAGRAYPQWSPSVSDPVVAGDRLTVVARRAGLSWLLKQVSPPPPVPGPAVAGRTGPPAPRGLPTGPSGRPDETAAAPGSADRADGPGGPPGPVRRDPSETP
jgi:Trk K+ transport system NAD-binding subunit